MEQKGAYTVKTLIKNGIVITQDPQDQVWEKGWLLLEEGTLRECARDGWTLEQTAAATGLPARVVEACAHSLFQRPGPA